MFSATAATSRLGRALAVALLCCALLDLVRSVYAQASLPGTPYPPGVPADVGDGWLLKVEAVTLNVSAPQEGQAAGPPILVTRLQVQNTAAEPRSFPTYRLHVVTGSGASQPDTWCGQEKNPLELSGQIPPNGTRQGTACWTMGSSDVTNVMLYVDPPPTDAGGQRGFFSLSPTVEVVAPAIPTSVAAPVRVEATAVAGQTGQGATDAARTRCSRVYSMQADSGGSYMTANCATNSRGENTRSPNGTNTGGLVAPGAAPGLTLVAPGALACQLYPSARQPSPSTGPSGSASAVATPLPTVAPYGLQGASPSAAYQGASSGGSC